MRVALVNDTFLEGRGADTVIYELAKRLGKKHEVFVLAGQTNIKEKNFKFIRLNIDKLYTGKIKDFNFFYKIARLRREIVQLQRQYCFDVFNLFHSSLNLAFLGFPAVVTWLGSPKTNNLLRKIVNKAMLITLKKDRTIVISHYLKNKIGSSNKIKVIYCGVAREFKPKKNAADKYMLYVGRLEKHKAIHELIKLSKELNFPLKIVGYGPIEGKLQEYSKKINADGVSFLGNVSNRELIKLYQECSFFVSASKWEGFGLIFLEAGACNKPSIGYDVGAVSEVIIDEKTGFLVKNFSELKQKAEELIKDRRLRENMGREALKHSRDFGWDKSAEEYERAYAEVKNGF